MMSPFERAASKGDLGAIKRMLRQGGYSIAYIDEMGDVMTAVVLFGTLLSSVAIKRSSGF
jgi:hypothetical protein